MKYFIRAILVCSSCCALFSCEDFFMENSDYAEKFVTMYDAGFVRDGDYLYRYSEAECQKVVNAGRQILRYQDDDQGSYVHFEMSSFPMSEGMPGDGGAIDTKIIWFDGSKTDVFILPLAIMKEEGEKYWLWNMESRMGIIAEF